VLAFDGLAGVEFGRAILGRLGVYEVAELDELHAMIKHDAIPARYLT
jgi:hypothetical protein